MPDETTKKLMSDLQEKVQQEQEKSLFEEIRDSLRVLNESQKTIKDVLQKQHVESIKKKTKEKTEKEPDEKKDDDTDKEMGALRKAFQESFSSLKDFVSPGGLMKSFGLLTGSPIFMLMGDKFDELISKYNQFREENNQAQKEQIIIQKEAMKDDFLKEEQRNEELKIAQRQVELLEDIKDKEFILDDEKKGLGDLIKTPLTLFSKLLPKRLMAALGGGALVGLFKKFLPGKEKGTIPGTGGFLPKRKGLLKGAGKILKGGARLLGKVALPLALITGGFDFVEGFRNALEITGKEDLTSKIQAGISEVISGFTFGLVDSKTIFKGVDFLTNKIKDIFLAPLDLIKDLVSGENIIQSVSNFISKFSYGLISSETLNKGISFLTNKLKSIFFAPFKFIKDMVSGENIIQSVSDFVSSKITFGLISPETLNKGISFLTDRIKDLFFAPLKLIKNLISGENIIQSVSDFISSKFTFGLISEESISQGLNFLKNKIITIFKSPLDFIQQKSINFGNVVSDGITQSLSGLTFGLISPEEVQAGLKGLYDKVVGTFINTLSDIKGAFKSIDIFGFFDNIDFDIGIDMKKAKETMDRLKGAIQKKMDKVLDFLSEPMEKVKGFFSRVKGIFSFDDEEPEINRGIVRRELIRYDINNDQVLFPVQRENSILNRVERETIREIQIERDRQIIKEQAERQQQVINNIINSTNNNLVVQEDLETRSSDKYALNAERF